MGKRKFRKTVGGTSVKDKRKTAAKENITKKTASKYKVDQLLDKAEDCIDRFEYEVAQKFCQRALEIEPDNLRVLETTGTLLLESDNPEGAKQCFGRAVELSPEEGHSKYMYLGQLLEGAAAIECFQKGIELMVKEKQAQQEQEVAAACAVAGDETISDYDISSAYCSVAEIYMTDCCFDESAEERCKEHVEKAIQADPENPEAYQLMANFLLSKDEKQLARENIKKSVSLWLPKFHALQKGGDPGTQEFDPLQLCPLSFESRMACGKILIEVEEFEMGGEVLEGLLDENDEVSEVWYLLGWLNYLQGEDYQGNARHYLNKAKQVYQKTKCKDEPLLKHTEELLEELGPGDEDEEEEGEDVEELETDEEEEEEQEGMEH